LKSGSRATQTEKYPDGPRLNLAIILIAQMLPKLFPIDPLQFGIENRKYGDITHYTIGPLHVYQLNSPELVRQILVEEPEKFQKARLLKRAFAPVAGNGLLTNDGDPWKQQRKLIQPAFNRSHLAEYARIMVTHSQRTMNSFRESETREIRADMVALTLSIVVDCLFGADFIGRAAQTGAMLTAVLEATNQRLNHPFSAPPWVPTPRNLRENRALRQIEAMLHTLTEERRASAEERSDLLSVLLRAADAETGAKMSDRQLRDEMMTLFLAGHETTANALVWIWYLLSQYPDVEAKLIEELDRVLGERAPTMADALPYTEMVIREALRIYPPAPGFAREPIGDATIGGYKIRKGSLLLVNSYALHRDPRFFEDPERFDPERFGPGWEERIPRYAYVPFGGGPRVCIGNGFAMMEARLIVATLARKWRFVLEPGQHVIPVQLVTVQPKNGLRVKLKVRTTRAEFTVASAAP
jgi:cytochrome P450